MQLTLRQKKLLKWIGYPLLALFTFVITLHITFPYDRVKGKVIEALSDKYDVAIAEVEPTFLPGGMIFTKIVLQTRPDDPKKKPKTIIIDKLRVDAGLIAMLRGRVDLDILAELGAGKITGNVLVASSGIKTSLSTNDLDLGSVPGIDGVVGLPMSGGLDAKISLNLPGNKWSRAEGRVEMACNGCTVGDGKTKITPRKRKRKNSRFRRRRRSFMDPTKGLTVPRLSLGNTAAVVVIKKGVGTIESFGGKSKDGEMKIEGKVRFADPFKRSKLPGCFHFKLSKSLKSREKNFGQIMDFLDVSADKDGWGHMKLVGNLPELSFRPVKACKPGVRNKRKRTKRPRVTTRRRPPRKKPRVNTANKVRNLKNNLKRTGPGKAKKPTVRKGITGRLKGKNLRGRSGPKLRDKLRRRARGKGGDDVKKGVKVDSKGRPSDSARPDNDDDDDDDDDDAKDKGDDDDDDDDDNSKRGNNDSADVD